MALFLNMRNIFGSDGSHAESSQSFSLVALGTNNATLIKQGPGVVTAIHAINVNAAVRYLKLFDTKALPTVGNTVPVRRYGIPGATTGAGFVLAPAVPMRFSNGIALALVTGITDADNTAVTASDVVLTIEYI